MAAEGSEFSHKDAESSEDMVELLFPKRRCCLFIPCFGSNRSPAAGLHWWQWQRMRTVENEGGWWARGISALKKLREWSEIIAGPRWKTFIRRFNRNKTGGSRHGKFQYDPLSYSLNFDDGLGQSGNLDEEYGFRNFSSRYAAIPTPTKSSVENGKDKAAFI